MPTTNPTSHHRPDDTDTGAWTGIVNARIFDGDTVLDASTVILDGPTIAGVGGPVPVGATVIDAKRNDRPTCPSTPPVSRPRAALADHTGRIVEPRGQPHQGAEWLAGAVVMGGAKRAWSKARFIYWAGPHGSAGC